MLAPYANSSDVNAAIALKLNIADTASMLAPYANTATVNAADALKLNIGDTAAMLAPYANSSDVNAAVNLKLNIADTAAMLAPYANTATVNAADALKLNIADTAAMLAPYANSSDVNAAVNLKLNIADTAAMLAPYANSTDVNAAVNLKLNIADTASMLAPYANSSDVNAAISLKLNIADTASMLAPYANTATVNAADALKLNIADTAAMLAPYAASISNIVSNYLPLSGGTLTGMATSTTGDAFRMQNNGAYISGFNDAGDTRTGFLQFNSGSDITLRAENSNQLLLGSGGNTALTLDANQKANFTSTVAASSFIKYGGDGTNLLLDDGTTVALSTLASSAAYLPLAGGNLSGTLNGTDANLSGNLIVSSGNNNGGGIVLADDGDIVDLNDGYGTMRFSNGIRITDANRAGSPVITLASSGAITANQLIKSGGDGTNLLLDDGTTVALSTLATSAAYLPLTGGTLTGTLIATDATFTGYAQLNNELRLADAAGTIKWQITPTGDDLSFTQTGVAPDQFMVKAGGNISAKGNANFVGQLTTGNVTYPNTMGTAGQFLAIDGGGTVVWKSFAVSEVADEFAATTAQPAFTLSQAPSADSKVKMFINGIRISNTAYSVSGTTLTYIPANNGAYVLTASDRIQFDYYY
jgi:hypothetical protein